MDAFTGTAAALGFSGPRNAYTTMTGTQLATGLLACALADDAPHTLVVNAGTLAAAGT